MNNDKLTRTLVGSEQGVMNYTRTSQGTPRLANISSFPFSNVSFNAEMYGSNSLHPVYHSQRSNNTTMYGYNSLHPLTHLHMLEGAYHG